MSDGQAPMDEDSVELLGHEEAVKYWDDRHNGMGELLSGGDVTFGHASNEAFYAVRLGRLLEIIQPANAPHAPRWLLDAGCGKGWFSRALAGCGYRVDGIDSSEHAIAEARGRASALERYAVATLQEWAPPYLYDVVVAVDVLFHLTRDEMWTSGITNLAALTRAGGLLVVSDHEHPGRRVWGNYQVTRGSDLYLELLGPLGFEHHGFSPYRFRGNLGGFHTFERNR